MTAARARRAIGAGPVNAARAAGWAVPAVVAAGGALGSAARYGLALGWPTRAGEFPWSTLVTNAVGCLAIGVLMELLAGTREPRPLLRAFLGTGVLGGFTTFSAYALDVTVLTTAGEVVLAGSYLAGTVAVAIGAVQLGGFAVRAATR